MGSYADISGGSGASFMGSSIGSLNPTGDPHHYLNAIPEAGFYAHLARQGLTGRDPTSQYAQGQFGRYYNMYQSDAAKDPNQGFYDWYHQSGIDPGQEFQGQSPGQRGDFTSAQLTPRARFVPYGG